jgi:hypothetical protein
MKIYHHTGVLAIALSLTCGNSSFASTIPLQQCNATLIQSTYMLTNDQFSDYRLAQQVDQSTYDEIQKSAGVNAVIYGVPVGASYSDFQKNISNMRSSTDVSLTQNDFTNIAWTGLTDANNQAYSACVNALVASSRGLNLFVERATDTDVVVSLNWTATGNQSNKINITWTSFGLETSALPNTAIAGTQFIDFKRPTKDTSIIVNSTDVGDASFIVLTPLPTPIKPVGPVLNTKCEIGATDRSISLALGQTANWLCPKMAAGKYTVTFSVPGDTPQGMARATYGVQLQPASGPNIVLAAQANADFRAPPGNFFPPVLQANSTIIQIPQGDTEFILSMGGVADLHTFADQHFGSVVLSPNVNIKLEPAN